MNLLCSISRRLKPFFLFLLAVFLVVLVAQEFHTHSITSSPDSCAVCHVQSLLQLSAFGVGVTALALAIRRKSLVNIELCFSTGFGQFFVWKRGPPLVR